MALVDPNKGRKVVTINMLNQVLVHKSKDILMISLMEPQKDFDQLQKGYPVNLTKMQKVLINWIDKFKVALMTLKNSVLT
tara:strand:+ start:155 stop:394 length:240 start_codon:yes stop_codon:yes gene_type:complete